MNASNIIWVTVLFVVFLGFCVWISFSARVISAEEILERVGIAAAVLAGVLVAAASTHHWREH